MSRTVTTTCCTIAVAAGALALGAFSTAAAAPTHPRARPDLVERGLGSPPARLVPGGSFSVTDRVLNRGSVQASRSWTRYYLRHGQVKLLVGARRIRRVAPHRGAAGGVVLRAPATAHAGRYSLIACADATRRVRESNERNNCTIARVRITLGLITGGGAGGGGTGGGPLPPGELDSDHDGFPDNLDCAPHDASIHPGAADVPDLKFVDSNCDGIDGDASRAIFVSPTGDDTKLGTEAAPKRTLAAAVGAADSQRKDVYATFGTYAEALALARGVSVYGGYTNSWARSPTNATRVTGAVTTGGDTQAAVASDVTTPTMLQLLTLRAERADHPGLQLLRPARIRQPGAAARPRDGSCRRWHGRRGREAWSRRAAGRRWRNRVRICGGCESYRPRGGSGRLRGSPGPPVGGPGRARVGDHSRSVGSDGR